MPATHGLLHQLRMLLVLAGVCLAHQPGGVLGGAGQCSPAVQPGVPIGAWLGRLGLHEWARALGEAGFSVVRMHSACPVQRCVPARRAPTVRPPLPPDQVEQLVVEPGAEGQLSKLGVGLKV